MRVLRLAAVVLFAACGGGSDGPTSSSSPATVRVTSASFTDVAAGTQVRVSVRNEGRAGQWRITAWADDAPIGCAPGTPNGIGCNPVPVCPATAGALIDPGATATVTATCGFRFGTSWVVVESQDGSSPAWTRTACIARVGECPGIIRPQR